MSINKWTTRIERFEIRVSGGDPIELLSALRQINEEAESWGEEVKWEVEEDSIVLYFEGSTESIGGWTK